MKKFAAALAAMAVLALPACGKSSASDSLKYVPSDATYYVHIANPYNWDSTKKDHVFTIIKGFGGTNGTSSFDEWLDKAFSDSSTSDANQISFTKDIKTWLGGSISVAGLAGTSSSASASPFSGGTLVIAPVKSTSAAKAFITKEENVSKSSALEIKGSTLLAINGSELCDTCSDAAAKAKATTELAKVDSLSSANTLGSSSTYKNIAAKVTSGQDLFAYINAKESGATNAAASSMSQCLTGSTSTANYLTYAISANMNASDANINLATSTKVSQTGTSGKLSIMNGLPDDTIFAADIQGLGPVIGKEFDCLGQSDPLVANSLKQSQQLTGLNFSTDFAWMKGESVISVGDFTAKEVGLVAEATDATAAKATVDKINTALGNEGIPTTQKSAGVYTAAFGAYVPDLTFGIKNGRFIIAGTSAYFNTLSAAAPKPLSGSAAYKAVINPGSSYLGALYVQPDQIATFAGPFISDAQTRTGLKEIDGVGFAGTQSGSYEVATGKIVFSSN